VLELFRIYKCTVIIIAGNIVQRVSPGIDSSILGFIRFSSYLMFPNSVIFYVEIEENLWVLNRKILLRANGALVI
jgi:hypothetical protein